MSNLFDDGDLWGFLPPGAGLRTCRGKRFGHFWQYFRPLGARLTRTCDHCGKRQEWRWPCWRSAR